MELKPCPSSPNCISSMAESSDREHYMEPLKVDAEPSVVLDAVADALDALGGVSITERTETRIDAVATTKILRFKDDVSFVVTDGHLHFRSASRIGHSDLGANRKRMTTVIGGVRERLA